MNIRDAILKAADHIEKNPHLFDFSKTQIPECGSVGCALGWIAHFMGIQTGERVLSVGKHLGIYHDMHIDHPFYSRMTDLTKSFWHDWKSDAKECARGMRLYADKYHPKATNWEEIASRRTVLPGEISQEVEFS